MVEVIIAIVSIILGASLQYIFSWLNSRSEKKKNLIIEACVEYLECIADIKFSEQEKNIEALARFVKAKTKIVLLGSSKLINLLEKFESVNPVLDNRVSIDAMKNIIAEMRISVFNGSNVSLKSIGIILFGHHGA